MIASQSVKESTSGKEAESLRGFSRLPLPPSYSSNLPLAPTNQPSPPMEIMLRWSAEESLPNEYSRVSMKKTRTQNKKSLDPSEKFRLHAFEQMDKAVMQDFSIAFLFIRHSKSHLSRNLMRVKDAVTFKEDMMNFVSIPYRETNRGCKYHQFQIGQRDYTGEKLF